jgi:O-methyltransferase
VFSSWRQRVLQLRRLWRLPGAMEAMHRTTIEQFQAMHRTTIEQFQAMHRTTGDQVNAILRIVQAAGLSTPAQLYEEWFRGVVGRWSQAPNTWPATSWTLDTPWGARIMSLMDQVEYDYAAILLEALEADGIRGPVVEFGVFQGQWLHVLINACEERGFSRQFFGFDSFQGLPTPSIAADLDCFHEGQFAAGAEEVARRLETHRRGNVILVPGWFTDTLPTSQVQAVHDISFARIDCDLYAPALECLRYLGPRLADGAVLVLDDWTFNVMKGETRAFAEWLPEAPDLTFELLCFNSVGHLYLRTRRR